MNRSLLLLPMLLACGDKPADDTGTPAGDDTGTAAAATNGLPEGTTTWSGTAEASGFTFLVSVTLENSGGDLTGSVTVADDPEAPLGIGEGTYTVQGTHAPESGLVALGPVEWTDEPDLSIELTGVLGTYDPDAGTIVGNLRDYASASDNTLQGGPVSVTLDSGDGEQSAVGDEAKALPEAESSFSGTMQCTSSVRDVEGTLTHDGQGGVSGSMTVGDTGVDTPLGTFPFDGVHNPTTGAITIFPQPWDEPAPSTVNFIISGSWDPSTGAWTGDQLTNTAACSMDTWDVVITTP